MKKYTIHYNIYATADVEVLADSEEDAKSKARLVELELKDYDFNLNEETIIDREDVPDLGELIQKASAIIKQYGEGGHEDFFNVPCYPTVTTQCWDGDEFLKQKNLVEDFYYDPEKGLMMDVGEGFEVELSELPELEQMEVCQIIIDSAKENGIEL
ncbi:MAG: hypothetical protein Q4A15_10955 [Prevotellaceae bacterium]|nr:hypothetical protein [Prevotellaceae bacterium]